MPKLHDVNYNERTPLISSQPKKRSSAFSETKRRKSRSPHHGGGSGRSSPGLSMFDSAELNYSELGQARPGAYQRKGTTGSGRLPTDFTQPQSASGGWAEEQTDDSDNSDVFRAVRKPPTDSNFQIYVICAVIVMIISVVGSVKLWEFIYGKPKIKENLFDFSMDSDKDND